MSDSSPILVRGTLYIVFCSSIVKNTHWTKGWKCLWRGHSVNQNRPLLSLSPRQVVLWNLQLDTLRSDLGLPAFPGKAVHYEFLSKFLPVFYLRQRDYSKTIPDPPYTLNYSGALFREFPGPWQVMRKKDGAGLFCVAERKAPRYTLFESKQELLVSLGEAEEKGSNMEFLRAGYKTSTWFEEDEELEVSDAWRM